MTMQIYGLGSTRGQNLEDAESPQNVEIPPPHDLHQFDDATENLELLQGA